MVLKDNFSDILLISERPVWFYLQDNNLKELKPIQMRIPSAVDMLTNPYLQTAIALLNMPIKDLQKSIDTIQFDNLWDLFIKIKQFHQRDLYTLHMEYFFHYCFDEQFSVSNSNWYIGGILLDADWFDRIVDITLVGCGLKKITEQNILQQQKPKWLIEKEEEIRRIKGQGKKQGGGDEFQELLKVLMPLNYELGYSFEELLNMNYFHIQTLLTYIPKIVSYDIQKRAVFSKQKIKYITDK